MKEPGSQKNQRRRRRTVASDQLKILINADDLGYHETFNEAIVEILEQGLVRSASIMAPGPSFDDAVQRLRIAGITDVGVHLTLSSEYLLLPVRPVSSAEIVPSLINDRGCFFRSINDVRDSLEQTEVRKELQAQIDKVLGAGFTISHLDGHMFFYEIDQGGSDLLATAESLADQCGFFLRCRSGSRRAPFAEHHMLWDEEKTFAGRLKYYEAFFRGYDSPVCELIVHPGKDIEAMRGFSFTGQRRRADHRFFSSALFSDIVSQRNIQVIGWSEILNEY